MTSPSNRFSVYVVELRPDEHKRFREKNPQHDSAKPCLYVGRTGLPVEKRLANHLAGVKSNSYVSRYAVGLMPTLYEGLNPMDWETAQRTEVELADSLRRQGYAVWQG